MRDLAVGPYWGTSQERVNSNASRAGRGPLAVREHGPSRSADDASLSRAIGATGTRTTA